MSRVSISSGKLPFLSTMFMFRLCLYCYSERTLAAFSRGKKSDGLLSFLHFFPPKDLERGGGGRKVCVRPLLFFFSRLRLFTSGIRRTSSLSTRFSLGKTRDTHNLPYSKIGISPPLGAFLQVLDRDCCKSGWNFVSICCCTTFPVGKRAA